MSSPRSTIPLLLVALAAFSPGGAASGDPVVDWLSTDGRTTASGRGTQVRIEGLSRSTRLHVDPAVSQGLVWGPRLFLVRPGSGLDVLELADPTAPPARLELPLDPRNALHLATLGQHLLVGESGRGIHLLALPPASHGQSHGVHRPANELEPAGFVPLERPFRALAAASGRIWVAFDDGELGLIDGPGSTPIRTVPYRQRARALAAAGSRLYVLGDRGLDVLDAALPGSRLASFPGLGGQALAAQGRTLHVAVDGGGVTRIRDETEGPQLFSVSVNDNFFSPSSLDVDPGDTVRWTNASGFHNVLSCTAAQTGCAGQTSDESFTSGDPAGPPWIYNHVFQAPGTNPYICLSHASIMAGNVNVGSPGPPGVPDGSSGIPLRVAKEAGGSTLSVSWEDGCAGATDHALFYSTGMRLPNSLGASYKLAGGICGITAPSPFAWTGSPDPSIDPAGLIWFLIVATDGAGVEGSWGTDSAGGERDGQGPGGASNQCDSIGKDPAPICAP